MRCAAVLCIVVALALTLSAGVSADNAIVTLGDELRLPVPHGWTVVDEASGHPYRIINDARTSELLIYRSVISAEEAIADETALRQSVDLALEEVIYGLPEAVLLTNTGYFRGDHAAFALDFLAQDSVLGIPLQHRMVCLVYGHPDGYQLMFTLWAKAAAADAEAVYADLLTMQDGLRYVGPARPQVFERRDRRPLVLLLALLPLLALMLARRLRKRRESLEPGTTDDKRRPARDAVQ